MHLVYITSATPYSDEETFIVPEIAELMRRGHRITVIPIHPRRSVTHEDARLLTQFTIAKSIFSISVIGNAIAEILRAPGLVLRSALLLAASRSFVILIKNLAVFPKALFVARVARRQGSDHIHAHFASTNATVAMVASVVSGIPWSFTAHRWDISENNLLHSKAHTAHFARAIDTKGAEELATFVRPHHHKVRVIHMGVAGQPPISEGPRTPSGSLRILIGARLDEFKGHRFALDAVSKLKVAGIDVLLECAGDGPTKVMVEKYAGELDVLDRVRFLGWLDHRELLVRLRNHHWDVALLPSLETNESREGIPVFLIEALAAGVPVVATATGGIPELLRDGAGLLVPQQDAEAIVDALALLAVDDRLRRRIVDAGRQRVRDHFAIESTVSALLDAIALNTPPALIAPCGINFTCAE